MNSRDFCYWLQGYCEIQKGATGGIGALDETQVECIARHLALVFKHEIDPSFGSAKKQVELNQIHSPSKSWPEEAFDVSPNPSHSELIRC